MKDIWPDLTFPPINLWNIYPSREMMETYDFTDIAYLFEDEDDDS